MFWNKSLWFQDNFPFSWHMDGGGASKLTIWIAGRVLACPTCREKNSGRKLQKMLHFRLFWKKCQNHALNFRAFGRKTIVWGKFEKILKIFCQNSMEKLSFYRFFGKSFAQNRNFGNHIIFLQHFLTVLRGGVNPPTPMLAPMPHCK